jgi:hypothetical protein
MIDTSAPPAPMSADELAQLVESLLTFGSFDHTMASLGLEELATRCAVSGPASPTINTAAWHAQQVIDGAPIVRDLIAEGNAEHAAGFALRVGWHFAQLVANVAREPHRRGGLARARQQLKAATQRDAEIVRLARRWQASEELQDQFRSSAAYIASILKLSDRSIRRRLPARPRRPSR